jgi:accessory gene regulator B
MDIITSLSKRTINFINKHDLINKAFTQEDYISIEQLIKRHRHKEVKITSCHVAQLAENGVMIFYGELFKYLIVLSMAYYLNILLPTFLIMNVFSCLRGLAGGVHMSSFNKCFAVMIAVFLSLGYIVKQIHMDSTHIFLALSLGLGWSLILALKYAPQERVDKSDKDCDNGNKMKYRTIIFIVVSFIVSMFLSNKIISISICVGALLEMLTITPIGTKIFKSIDQWKVINWEK